MKDSSDRPLLSEKDQDVDRKLIGVDPESSGSDDECHNASAADRRILDENERYETLLSRHDRFDGVKRIFDRSRNIKRAERNVRRGRRLKQEAEGSGSTELMYEMEGGIEYTSSRSSSESTELKQKGWRRPQVKFTYAKIALITFSIAALFVALAVGAYKVSHKRDQRHILSNGTHPFGATTILISLDGFRADFLQRGLTPVMSALVSSGVSPRYMLPSFPSLTFPNHFTLVTGLYPESHGIVSNQFWDPQMKEEFYYTNTSNSMQPKWWNAEPVWVTAENQGFKTAIHMWPGSEAHIGGMDPTYMDRYNGAEALDVKVRRLLGWLDLPQHERPQFIGAYVPNVDADGHRFGPNSTEIRKTIVEVDSMLGSLMEGLLARNLTEVVNLIIVSDHGMATTSTQRILQLDDYIDMDLVDHMDGWPLRGLRLKNPDRDVPLVYHQLLEASKDKPFRVYTTETMPVRYHFSQNDRIAPLWIIPDAGWVVLEKSDFHVAEAKATGQDYHPYGLHGYDHEHPLMRAIFIARGPAFPHKPNSLLPAFQNTEVYNIVCDSLGITPHMNNGTLRLPLRTEGLHSDYTDPVEIPADPVENEIKSAGTVSTASFVSPSMLQPTETNPAHVVASETAVPDRPEGSEGQEDWLGYLRQKVQEAKNWAKDFFASLKGSKGDVANT